MNTSHRPSRAHAASPCRRRRRDRRRHLAGRRAGLARLVPAPGAVGRRRAGGAGRRRRLVLAGAPDRQCGAQLHHADGGARQPDPDRDGQRHAAAHARDQHRQRTVGHGGARSTSTSTTASARARCWSSSTPPSCATRSCARAPRWPRRTRRSRRPSPPCSEARASLARLRGSGAPVRRQGAVARPSSTRRADAGARAWPTRPAPAPASPTRRRRCPPTRPTCRKASIRSPIDGVVLTRTRRSGQRRGGVAAGGDAVHRGRGPGAAAPAGQRRRGRRRLGQGGPEGHLHRQRLSRAASYPAHDHPRGLRLDHHRQRRHLPHLPGRGQQPT